MARHHALREPLGGELAGELGAADGPPRLGPRADVLGVNPLRLGDDLHVVARLLADARPQVDERTATNEVLVGAIGPRLTENGEHGATTMRWLPDRARPDVLAGSRLVYRQVGAPVSTQQRKTFQVLKWVGLQHRMNAYPAELSGGEQQRVAMARAFMTDPKILFADEPTGNLDPKHAWDVIKVLEKVNRYGTTVLLTTHNQEIVNALKRRVVTIKDGKIVKTEKISSLLDGTYKRFHLETAKKVDKSYFANLSGVGDLTVKGLSVSFLFKGRINDATQKIAGLDLTNLLVEEPDLEEIFMHYYQKD